MIYDFLRIQKVKPITYAFYKWRSYQYNHMRIASRVRNTRASIIFPVMFFILTMTMYSILPLWIPIVMPHDCDPLCIVTQ